MSSVSVSDNALSSLHNEVRNLALIQSHMLEWSYVAQQGTTNDGSTLWYINTIDEHINTDMVVLLDASNNKAKTLQTYITYADTLLLDAQGHVLELEQERQNKAFQRNECLQNKAVADNIFFRWLENNDTSSVDSGLAWSKEYGICEVQLRIEYNALGAIIAKLNKKRSLLMQKRDLLAANQDAIVENFTYFKDRQLTLETLATLRSQLEKIERTNKLLE